MCNVPPGVPLPVWYKNGHFCVQGFHSNVVGLSISLDGKVATVTEDQVLKVFDIRDLSSKSFPSQRTSLARVPVDVAFAKSGEVFVLTEVRHVTLSNLPIPIASRHLIMPKKEGSFCKKQFHFIHRLSCEAICMVRDLCFTSQGPLGNAILELFNLETSKLSQEWEIADVHGREAGKGVLAGVTQYGLSVALTYSGQTDLQVFTAKAKPLASVNSSGQLRQARPQMSRSYIPAKKMLGRLPQPQSFQACSPDTA